MSTKTPSKLTRLAATLLTLLSLAATTQHAQAAGDFVVLVHKTNNVATMSEGELRRALLGATKQWGNGAPVQVGVIPSAAPETTFLAAKINSRPDELIGRMQQEVFRGEMRRPVVLRGPGDCVAFAKANPGAICASSRAALTGHEAEVHVVTLQ